MNKWIFLYNLREDFLKFVVMYKTWMPHVNRMKDVRRGGIKLYVIFRYAGIFSGESVHFKGGEVLVLGFGRTFWDLDSITLLPPLLTPQYHGDVGRFEFDPHRHGAINLCLYYEGCELWWVLMVWQVDVFGVILSMLCIMCGRRVCCIVGMCTVDNRQQRTRVML